MGRGRTTRSSRAAAAASSPADAANPVPSTSRGGDRSPASVLMPPPKSAPAVRLPAKGKRQTANKRVVNQSHNSTQQSTSNTSRSRNGDLDKKEKEDILNHIVDMLQEVQTANASSRRTIFKAFQKKFYKETSSPIKVNDYQKYFAQILWRLAIIPFQKPHSPPINQTVEFLYKIFYSAGTAEDKLEVGFKVTGGIPMFFYILKLVIQSHMDTRQMVRLRVMEAAYQILQRHHADPVLSEHHSIRNQFLSCLATRLRDKYAPVRVLSAMMHRYFFEDDSTIIKDLKYYARFDPHADVRKAAISSLKELPSTKAAFFYDLAFDRSLIVRIEAFGGLASTPMLSLAIDKREKVLYWGLTQEDKVKRYVFSTLIPAWLTECGNNPIEFLKRLGVTNNTKVAFTVLHNLYRDNNADTFDAIDRSFLNENRLIPVSQLTLESVIFWIFLVKKFGKVRFNVERLLPAADLMAPYIKEMIKGIHEENEKAQAEDREENVTLLMCLGYILSLTVFIGLEEGTRRLFEELMTEILLDPILDEAPLIKNSVDIMKNIIDARLFPEKMMSIFQQVFDPNEPTITEGTPRNRSRSQRLSKVQSQNGEGQEDMEVDRTLTEGNDEPELDVEPARPAPHLLTEGDLFMMKDKVCNLAMERLRLGEQKATAIKGSNFLEAHRLQELIDAVLKEETEIRVQIITPHNSLRMSENSINLNHTSSSVAGPSRGNVSSKSLPATGTASSGCSGTAAAPPSTVISRDRTDEEVMSQIPASQNKSGVVLSEQNLLRGLVMLTQFLSLHRKMTPFIRQLYENHIVFCLTEEDPRIRTYVLHLLCLIAIIDGEEKRKIMALMLRALEAEADVEVKSVAFKGVVDLLLEYKFEDFKLQKQGDQLYNELSDVYNNADATVAELEEMFIVALDKFADEESGMKTAESISVKVMGIIKLLQVSRIKSENIISELLCMWSDKQYRGSAVPFNIGMWLSTYTKLRLSNAKLVAKALILSVKRILNAQDEIDNTLSDADHTKLLEFVIPTLDPRHLSMPNGNTVQEDLALMIFKDVLENPKWTSNAALVKITTKCEIITEGTAKEIADVIVQICLKISSFPQTTTVSTLKVALRAAMKRLNKLFENIAQLPDPRRNSGSSSEDDNAGQPGVFSDSDEESPSFVSNVNSPPPLNKSGGEESDADDKNEKEESENGSATDESEDYD